MRKNNVSSRDVAREAGVSQATVSYVLNNTKNITLKPETREAVLKAIEKLNYHPDQIARGMKLQKSMSIGVVTDRNITNFYFSKTLEGIKDGLLKDNYSITLLFNHSEGSPETEHIKYYDSKRIDGIIFAFASISNELINSMKEKGIPFVSVNTGREGGGIYEVCSDHLDRINEVMLRFKKNGAVNIGYAGPAAKCRTESKFEVFKKAAEECGLSLKPENFTTTVWDDGLIKEKIQELLLAQDRPDAILGGTPRFGIMALKCAQMLGIKVPEELQIAALGSSNFYMLTHPSLTAFEIPLYDMGFCAARKLIDIINGEEVPEVTVLPSELVPRETS